MSRDLESVALEAEYWRLVLSDLLELSNTVAAAYEPIPGHGLCVLELMIGERDVTRIERLAALTTTVGQVGEQVARMQDPIMRLIDLATGRCKALEAEADLPARGSDDAGEQ